MEVDPITPTTEEAQGTGGSTDGGEAEKPTQQETADKLFSGGEEKKDGEQAEGGEPKEGDEKDKDEDGKSKDSDGDKDKVPESYSDFNLPEGVVVDEAALGDFQGLAKELNLSQEKAQKVIDLYTKTQQGGLEKQKSDWQGVIDGWDKDSQADKEFGGDAFKGNMGIANKAFKQFGNDAFKDALVTSGMGNHPELIRFMIAVGKGMSEDKFNDGGSPTTGKTAANILFKNQK